MKSKRISQKELALELLKERPSEWIPTWKFVGEVFINGKWNLMSYSVPKRLSDLFYEGLVERKLVKGKSGAQYYEYKVI